MTAVKHTFESNDAKLRRFKVENLLESSTYTLSKFCNNFVFPSFYPKSKNQNPHPYVVPFHSRWFDYNSIHKIERMFFPDLQNDEEYMEIRNEFVKIFRLFPKENISPGTIRHIHGGDYDFIMRIYEFLNMWGLINFRADNITNTQPGYRENLAPVTHTEFSNLAHDFKAPISPPVPPLLCPVCKCEVADGQFVSEKYPSLAVCPRCFAHPLLFDQSGVSHKFFKYVKLPRQQRRACSLSNNESSMYDGFNGSQTDWFKLAEKTENKPPGEILAYMMRSHDMDPVLTDTIATHHFPEVDVTNELLQFVGSSTPQPYVGDLHYNESWDAVEGELSELEQKA